MKTFRIDPVAMSLIAALLLGCGSTRADRSRVHVGMTKSQVLEVLGEPARAKTSTKQSESIWGPPEEWWGELKVGDAYETWSWKFPGEGTYSVYFLRGEPTVRHVSFMDEGVVYESSS